MAERRRMAIPDRLAPAVTAGVSQSRCNGCGFAVGRMYALPVHPAFRKGAVEARVRVCRNQTFILPIFHLAVMIGKGGLPQY
jgi:hypothetical protein